MQAEPGQDLWHGPGGNLDAPRLLLKIEGDFSAECPIRLSPDMKEHGGLIIWKTPQAFIRLEKTSGPHAFRGDIRFERHVDGVFSLVGRGTGVDKRMWALFRLDSPNFISGLNVEVTSFPGMPVQME